jgi:acetyl esterase/lipase
MKKFSALLCALCVLCGVTLAAEPLVLDVWPGKPPGLTGDIGPEKIQTPPGGRSVSEKTVMRLTNVSRPTLTVYRPAKDKDTGAAVLINPGGAYNILAWDLEGTEVAAWLNSIGVTGIVLKYRVPRPLDLPKGDEPVQPLMDAQRALSLVRSKAAEWGLDPQRIGALGFSAGGHLTAALATNFDKRAYEPLDDVDKVSCRPDFAVLVYPAYLVDKANPSQLSPKIRVSAQTPPTFIVAAFDDKSYVVNSPHMWLALKAAGVPAELHVYETGGHGFGLRPSDKPSSTWPKRCAEWMQARGLLKGK